MPDEELKNSRVTFRFNMVLLLVWLVFAALQYALQPRDSQGIFLDQIIASFPSFERPILMTMLAMIVASIFVTGWCFKEFWNRFLSRVFALQHIDYQEGLSIALILLFIGDLI